MSQRPDATGRELGPEPPLWPGKDQTAYVSDAMIAQIVMMIRPCAIQRVTQCSHAAQPTDRFHSPSTLSDRPFHLGTPLAGVLPKGSARLRAGRALQCAP